MPADAQDIGPRQSRLIRIATPVCSVLLCLTAVVFSAELHLKAGLTFYTEQGLAVILSLALALIFVTIPAVKSQTRTSTPWYDMIFAALGLGAGLYLAIRFSVLTDEFFYRQKEAFVIGIILIPLTIEGLRRTAGWSLTSIVLFFFVYAFWGNVIPGKLQGRAQTLETLVPYVAVDNVALFGLPMTIVCTIVVMFIFMGQMLLKSGGSEWFTDIATALMGGSRGGSAKIAIVASGLFGSISGSAVSNVASTGVITIPLMRQSGYEPKVAGAFEAVASTGGQIMPPIMGAAAFLMAEFLEIAYTEVVIAAIIPAVLYYVAVFFYADLEAARKNIAPVPKERIPSLRRTIKEGWFFVLPFAVLIYALFALNVSPEESALWAVGSIILVSWIFGYKGKRLSLREIYDAIRGTGRGAVDIVIIGAMAGMIIGIIEVTGLGFGLTFVLVEFGEGNLIGLMVLTALICIILGMGMPTTAIYFLVATLAAPPLIKLGVNPLAAHMFVLYFGLVSLITPPVAVAAFVAANLAKSRPMETAVTSVRIGWTALVVPMMFVLSPNLIMQGEPLDIVIAVITAFVGVWLVTAGIMRYFVRPMGAWLCAGFIVAGGALLLPARAFDGAIYIEVAGIALALLLIGREVRGKRHELAAGPVSG